VWTTKKLIRYLIGLRKIIFANLKAKNLERLRESFFWRNAFRQKKIKFLEKTRYLATMDLKKTNLNRQLLTKLVKIGRRAALKRPKNI
jgi:hypothetical protein